MNDEKKTAGPWVTTTLGQFPSRSVRCCQLKVTRGADKGQRITVRKPRFTVGALPSNDLKLNDPAVSGHHFELLLEQGRFRLRDLGSRNGTFVGDVQVLDALLPAKARIQLGDTRINFDIAKESVEVPAAATDRFGPLVGQSVVMRELFAELERIAASDSTVLITGETGTGKEAVAEALVGASPRAKGPLVIVDCGALAPTLVEAELFGHERGAYTGANTAASGAFERADGGTIMLDEIGELPLQLQPKLLRVLEAHEVQRLGGSSRRRVDIRVLAATHRALDEQVNKGTFRPDLYYRLSVLTVRVPPLRDRAEDVPLLIDHFLSRMSETMSVAAQRGVESTRVDQAVLERLVQHSWPGNVRELRNAVERLVLGSDPLAGPRPSSPSATPQSGAASSDVGGPCGDIDLETPFRAQKDQLVRDFERRYAKALLEFSPGNVSKAARKAGLDRMAVVKLFQRHGLGKD